MGKVFAWELSLAVRISAVVEKMNSIMCKAYLDVVPLPEYSRGCEVHIGARVCKRVAMHVRVFRCQKGEPLGMGLVLIAW